MNASDLACVAHAARLTRAAQIASGGPRNRCIAHTRQLIAILAALGYAARPTVVRAVVENEPGVRARRQFAAAPTFDWLKRAAETGGCSIEIGWAPGSVDEWSGHLIADIPALRCYVDVSLDQINDPAHGFDIDGPLIFVAASTEETMAAPDGNAYPGICIPLDNGGAVLYHVFRNDQGFTTAPEWIDAFSDRPENALVRFLLSVL